MWPFALPSLLQEFRFTFWSSILPGKKLLKFVIIAIIIYILSHFRKNSIKIGPKFKFRMNETFAKNSFIKFLISKLCFVNKRCRVIESWIFFNAWIVGYLH